MARAPWPRYPEFVPARLLERLAEWFRWPADGILAGNGSNELIQATLAVTVEPGDAVVGAGPDVLAVSRADGGDRAGATCRCRSGADFQYDMDRAHRRRGAGAAEVVVLNSPNNPTGIGAARRARVERVLAETGALVLCDEAYMDFGGPTAMSALAASDRVVVLRTFSKALALAGLRFGLALAHPAVAREIAKAKLPYNVNLFTLTAAEVALEHMDVRQGLVSRIIATRDRAFSAAQRAAGLHGVPERRPTSSWCGSSRVPASEVYRRLLQEHDILVRDVSAVPGLEQCLRISVGTEADMVAVETALRRSWREVSGA